jgi:hypothetical protein
MVILHRMIAASDLNLGFFQVSFDVILLKFTLKFTWAMFCEVVGRWPVAIHHAVDGEWLYGQPEGLSRGPDNDTAIRAGDSSRSNHSG